MIGVLGMSPISSITSTAIKEFYSLLRPNPSVAFGEDSGRFPRVYTETRGILINKEYVEAQTLDLNKGYRFQFNPQTITDIKNTLYETRQYAGLPYSDYIWGGGGERTIAFQLFLDNTPQSKYRSFRPSSYGSTCAKEIKTEGATGYTYDAATGKYTLDKRHFGQDFVEDVASQGKTAWNATANTFTASRGPSKFEYVDGDSTKAAFSPTRVSERGILPEVELIQSFLYPAPLTGETTPLFASGGVVSNNQFRPPATVVLSIGPIYLEGVVKSAPVTYTLFDKDLTPIRGTIDIEFAVFEFETIDNKIATVNNNGGAQ